MHTHTHTHTHIHIHTHILHTHTHTHTHKHTHVHIHTHTHTLTHTHTMRTYTCTHTKSTHTDIIHNTTNSLDVSKTIAYKVKTFWLITMWLGWDIVCHPLFTVLPWHNSHEVVAVRAGEHLSNGRLAGIPETAQHLDERLSGVHCCQLFFH